MNDAIWHDSFYRFVRVDEPDEVVAWLEPVCREAGVLGTVLVAEEGVNGMLAGSEPALDAVRKVLDSDARFAGLFYKRTGCKTEPFERLKVRRKAEIVPLGLEGVDAVSQRGVDVPPEKWRALIEQEDVILIDNRNSFEYRLGHFRGAVDPGVNNFRDFAAYAESERKAWQGKRVAMYCTGGIRCEKTSAWLAAQGLTVYQLEGGILGYFKAVPDASEDFTGECFVFDARVSLDTQLRETGARREDVG